MSPPPTLPPARSSELTALRAQLQQARVLVVGDVMLDRYCFGDVDRISPEAPVPVVLIQRIEERAGGAANVARNITAVGGQTTLLSVVGTDEPGAALERLLRACQVTPHLHRDPTISTTVKQRVVARQQQLIRLDFEVSPSHEVLATLLGEYRTMLSAHDVVILSDYGKGGLTHVGEMITLARAAGKPVLIDPKGSDYSRYQNATLLTPNRAELRQVVGVWRNEIELRDKAESLRQSLKLDALLLTRSEEGMSLFLPNQVRHQATRAREVFDVSGAGDTVIAIFAAMLAVGLPMETAMSWSNAAAGIVVGKQGTAVASTEELFGTADGASR